MGAPRRSKRGARGRGALLSPAPCCKQLTPRFASSGKDSLKTRSLCRPRPRPANRSGWSHRIHRRRHGGRGTCRPALPVSRTRWLQEEFLWNGRGSRIGRSAEVWKGSKRFGEAGCTRQRRLGAPMPRKEGQVWERTIRDLRSPRGQGPGMGLMRPMLPDRDLVRYWEL